MKQPQRDLFRAQKKIAMGDVDSLLLYATLWREQGKLG